MLIAMCQVFINKDNQLYTYVHTHVRIFTEQQIENKREGAFSTNSVMK